MSRPASSSNTTAICTQLVMQYGIVNCVCDRPCLSRSLDLVLSPNEWWCNCSHSFKFGLGIDARQRSVARWCKIAVEYNFRLLLLKQQRSSPPFDPLLTISMPTSVLRWQKCIWCNLNVAATFWQLSQISLSFQSCTDQWPVSGQCQIQWPVWAKSLKCQDMMQFEIPTWLWCVSLPSTLSSAFTFFLETCTTPAQRK